MTLGMSVLLCGCADEKREPVMYVYRAFLDRDEGGYTLHILASEDASLQNGMTDEENGTNTDTIGSFTTQAWMTYGGKTPEAPFEAFLKENPHAYTASMERYMWGEALNEEDRYRITRYLMDTPPWPLARPGFPAYDEQKHKNGGGQ